MPYKYSVVARKNPGDPNSPYKYYPQPQSSGESGFKALARKIQKNTGQSYADVIGVLAALEDVLPEEIKNGLIVRLGDIGSLYASYKTVAADTPEEVTAKNIEEVRVRFRPDKDFLEQVNIGKEFEKVETNSAAATEEEPEEAVADA